MRPALGFGLVIIVAVALAAYTSHLRPAPDLPPSEQQEAQNNTKTDAGTGKAKTEPAAAMPTGSADREAEFNKYKERALRATMKIEGRGTLILELYPRAAPKTVAHFTDLIQKHFYDGILFHRVEPGFVVQGGDPESKKVDAKQLQGLTSEQVTQQFHLGSSGSGESVPLEAKLPHIPNSIGLARSNDPDSGDSQFYFNLKDNGASLDGKYCVFGRVVGGVAILPKIQIGDRIEKVTIP